MDHIFISYSTQNGNYANKLADKLRDERFNVWIDNASLLSSDDWIKSIDHAIITCSAFLVVMTPQSNQSEWVQREVALAVKLRKPIFPVLLAGESWGGILFTRIQHEDVRLQHPGKGPQFKGKFPPSTFYTKLAEVVPRQIAAGVNVVHDLRDATKKVEGPGSKPKAIWTKFFRAISNILAFVSILVLISCLLSYYFLSKNNPNDHSDSTKSFSTSTPINTSLDESQPTDTSEPNVIYSDALTLSDQVNCPGGIGSLAWSPDHILLASGTRDGQVCLWPSGNLLPRFKHPSAITAISWSPNGKNIALGDSDDVIWVYDQNLEKLRAILQGDLEGIQNIKWSADGSFVMSYSLNDTVRIWDLRLDGLLEGTSAPIWAGISTLQYGRIVPDANLSFRKIMEADLTEMLRTIFLNTGVVGSADWSPDGRFFSTSSPDSFVRIWDVENSDLFSILNGPPGGVNGVSWSSDGKRIAAGSRVDNYVRIWDIESKTELSALNCEMGQTDVSAWSSSGTYLAAGSNEKGAVCVWDVMDGDLLGIIRINLGIWSSLAWIPDGSRLAIGSDDGVVQIWELESPQNE